MKIVKNLMFLLASLLFLSGCGISHDTGSAESVKPVEYTITWKNYDGSILKTDIVESGTKPEYYGPTPTRESNQLYKYTYAGWVPKIVPATSDTFYTAYYNTTVKQYEVTWRNYDGSLLGVEKCDYGRTPAYKGTTPTKVSTDPAIQFEFLDWYPSIRAVSGDITYTAYFEETTAKYDVVFDAGEGYFDGDSSNHTKTITCEYGTVPQFDEIPTVFSRQYAETTFTGWDKEFETVYANQTYKAEYSFCKENDLCIEYQYVKDQTSETVSFSLMHIVDGEVLTTCDWGDGSTKNNNSKRHTYSTFGLTSCTYYIRVFATYRYYLKKATLSFVSNIVGYNNGIKRIDCYAELSSLVTREEFNVQYSSYDPFRSEIVYTPNLEIVNFHEGVRNLSYLSFYSLANLKEVRIGGTNTYVMVSDYTFYNCKKLELFAYETTRCVVGIGDHAFYNCSSLTKLILPSGCEAIGGHAFYNCSSLTKLILSSGCEAIGDRAFYNCSSLSALEYNDGVANSKLCEIGSYAFYACKFASFDIPKKTNTIGEYAFGNCLYLSSVCYHGSQSDFANLTISSTAFSGTKVTNISCA